MTKKTIIKSSRVEWGRPSIQHSLCTACGCCVSICPSLCLAMEDGKPVAGPDRAFGCLACGHCMAVCPSGAIHVTGRRLDDDAVFPLPPLAERATGKSLEGLLQARRSARHYKGQEIERSTIDRLLTMASTAPMGFPPSEVGVVVINGREKVQALAKDLVDVFKKWLFLSTPVGSLILRLMMDKPTVQMMQDFVLPVAGAIIEARKNNKDLLFYDAPCVILFHYPMKDTVDPAIACSFATIAAEGLGLGSCMIGTVAPALRGNNKLKTKWGIPMKCFPSIAMTLGYPSITFPKGIRRRFASLEYV